MASMRTELRPAVGGDVAITQGPGAVRVGEPEVFIRFRDADGERAVTLGFTKLDLKDFAAQLSAYGRL